MPRSRFKRSMEGAIEGSFIHSTLIRGTLLFSHDDSIGELFERRHHMGARDREIGLMRAGASVIWALAKAQKWLHVKNDVEYSFFWIMKVLDSVATIEVLQQGENPGREVILQALRLNSEFFRSVYTDLIHGEKNRDTIMACLEKLEDYIRARQHILFRPVLCYLSEAGGIRSSTEMNHYLTNNMGFSFGDTICEWLADEEIIQKVSSPVRLTEKSRVDVEEAAYYYEEEIEG
jgi:uncharacterized protein